MLGFIAQDKSIGPEAIFLSYADDQNVLKDPEIYPREDGTVYVCGESDHFPVPEDPALVSADPVSMASNFVSGREFPAVC